MKKFFSVGLCLFSIRRQRQVQRVVVELAETSEEFDGGRRSSQPAGMEVSQALASTRLSPLPSQFRSVPVLLRARLGLLSRR